MNCLVCRQSYKYSITSGDCLDAALDSIRRHYLYLKKTINEKDKEVEELQERNNKLMNAVELLQREKQDTASVEDTLRKRRKNNSFKTTQKLFKTCGASSSDDISFNDEVEPQSSKLNVALNSEELFDCSDSSFTANGRIAETETMISSQILRVTDNSDSYCDYQNFEKNENIKPLTNKMTDSEGFKNTDWMAKQHGNSVKTWAGKGTRYYLSLNKKKTKFKQTRLQLDIKRGKCVTETDPTSREGVVNGSPKPHNSVNQSNILRSWMLRTGSGETPVNPPNTKPIATVDDEFVFDYTPTPVECNISQKVPKDSEKKTTDSCSILLLTPATQDIVFLDDTCEDTPHKLMDWQFDNTGSCNISQCEGHRAQKPEKRSIKNASNMETANVLKKSAETILSSKQPKILEQIKNIDKTALKIKQEKIMQVPNKGTANEYVEDILVRPILIKEEPRSEDMSDLPRKIQERFNIDCDDCQKYIDFMGSCMTAKQIEDHLDSCSRHKKCNERINLTPDDFWNPLMVSFSESDPRKEVLIDRRFVGKK